MRGLVAVVTGGAAGIGAATVSELLGHGVTVAVLDRDLPSAQTGASLAVQCDVSSTRSVTAAVEQVGRDLGGVDLVVNNAGIGATGSVADGDESRWLSVFDVNVLGPARVVRAALPFLRRSAHACVVNVSSVVAFVGVPQRAIYAASKGAVAAMTLAMAADHVHDGIRVNAVSPGTTDTPWVQRLLDQAGDPQAAAAALRGRQPMGRLVSPEEVARAIVYLLHPASASTTGTVLAVDGGMGGVRLPPPPGS